MRSPVGPRSTTQFFVSGTDCLPPFTRQPPSPESPHLYSISNLSVLPICFCEEKTSCRLPHPRPSPGISPLSFQVLISYFFVPNGMDGAPNVFIAPNHITHSSLFRLLGI
ncbi:hypothetical protein KSP39_PZI007804 [Platanthera zijinensis]|uniref:Uncharacterized protein n=1 Tax=Platanthera zijinensis TaxID=2320716 RepID=A0AAP0BMV6_9ASPA